MMWFYTAAKAIGFDKFTSQNLAKYMRQKTNVHMPLTRSLINPGPKEGPAIKQPYSKIYQWKGGKWIPASLGKSTASYISRDGWINGF